MSLQYSNVKKRENIAFLSVYQFLPFQKNILVQNTCYWLLATISTKNTKPAKSQSIEAYIGKTNFMHKHFCRLFLIFHVFFSLFLAPKEFCFCHTKNVIFQLSNADLPLIFMKPAAAAVHKRAVD